MGVGFDCGVFVCLFADLLLQDVPLKFSQKHATLCRQRITLRIASHAVEHACELSGNLLGDASPSTDEHNDTLTMNMKIINSKPDLRAKIKQSAKLEEKSEVKHSHTANASNSTRPVPEIYSKDISLAQEFGKHLLKSENTSIRNSLVNNKINYEIEGCQLAARNENVAGVAKEGIEKNEKSAVGTIPKFSDTKELIDDAHSLAEKNRNEIDPWLEQIAEQNELKVVRNDLDLDNLFFAIIVSALSNGVYDVPHDTWAMRKGTSEELLANDTDMHYSEITKLGEGSSKAEKECLSAVASKYSLQLIVFDSFRKDQEVYGFKTNPYSHRITVIGFDNEAEEFVSMVGKTVNESFIAGNVNFNPERFKSSEPIILDKKSDREISKISGSLNESIAKPKKETRQDRVVKQKRNSSPRDEITTEQVEFLRRLGDNLKIFHSSSVDKIIDDGSSHPSEERDHNHLILSELSKHLRTDEFSRMKANDKAWREMKALSLMQEIESLCHYNLSEDLIRLCIARHFSRLALTLPGNYTVTKRETELARKLKVTIPTKNEETVDASSTLTVCDRINAMDMDISTSRVRSLSKGSEASSLKAKKSKQDSRDLTTVGVNTSIVGLESLSRGNRAPSSRTRATNNDSIEASKEEDNLILKFYKDIMEYFKEEKGCKNPEMFLDCLGITFIFDTKSKKEKMIALKYLENCFFAGYELELVKLIDAWSQSRGYGDGQSRLYSINKNNDYICKDYQKKELRIATWPMSFLICENDAEDFIASMEKICPHIPINSSWKKSRLLFSYTTFNTAGYLPMVTFLEVLENVEQLTYLKVIQSGQNVPLTEKSILKLDEKLKQFQCLEVKNKMIYQLDLAFQGELEKINGHCVAPMVKWLKKSKGRADAIDDIRSEKYIMYTYEQKVAMKHDNEDLLGGVTIRAKNSRVDHEKDCLEGLGIFSKIKIYSSGYNLVRAKKHLVINLKDEIVENRTLRTLRTQAKTLVEIVKYLQNHKFLEKICKPRIEFTVRPTGSTLSFQVRRSSTFNLRNILEHILDKLINLEDDLGVDMETNAESLPRFDRMFQLFDLYMEQIKNLTVGRNTTLKLNDLNLDVKLFFRWLWANCLMVAGLSSKHTKNMLDGFLRNRDESAFRSDLRQVYSNELNRKIEEEEAFNLFDSHMLPLSAQGIRSRFFVIERPVAREGEEMLAPTIDDLDKIPPQSLRYYEQISIILHFYYRNHPNMIEMFEEQRFKADFSRKPTIDNMRKVMLPFSQLGNLPRRTEETRNKLRDLLPEIIERSYLQNPGNTKDDSSREDEGENNEEDKSRYEGNEECDDTHDEEGNYGEDYNEEDDTFSV